jgi:nucleoside-diphosphate-sugar epimerase
MNIQKIFVTGSNGMIGRVVVQDLRAHGCHVTPVDKYSAHKWGTKIVDCEDLGQVVSVMKGHDAVVHLAAIPEPISHPVEVVFRNNVISTFNILEAAAILGIKNIVLASSISALGTAFKHRDFNPLRIPIDETHPLLAQDAYGLSKIVGEELAAGYCRRIPDLSLTSLRLSLVVDDAVRERFLRTVRDPVFQDDHAGIFWSFVDVRDAASSCWLALQANLTGHEAFYIAAPAIFLDDPIEDLLARYYPGDYPIAAHIHGSASPVDCSKAARILGWKAEYDWEGNHLQLGS